MDGRVGYSVRWSACLPAGSSATDPALPGRLVDGQWSGPAGSGSFEAVRVEYHPPPADATDGEENDSWSTGGVTNAEAAAVAVAAAEMAGLAGQLGRPIHPKDRRARPGRPEVVQVWEHLARYALPADLASL